MNDDCIFCEIAEEQRPVSIVYADDLTLAFFDTRQLHHGHTLVIPR